MDTYAVIHLYIYIYRKEKIWCHYSSLLFIWPSNNSTNTVHNRPQSNSNIVWFITATRNTKSENLMLSTLPICSMHSWNFKRKFISLLHAQRAALYFLSHFYFSLAFFPRINTHNTYAAYPKVIETPKNVRIVPEILTPKNMSTGVSSDIIISA